MTIEVKTSLNNEKKTGAWLVSALNIINLVKYENMCDSALKSNVNFECDGDMRFRMQTAW